MLMDPTAIVQLSGAGLQLVRHPHDGRVVAFDDADAAFAFAVSLELTTGTPAGTVTAPEAELLHMLERGATAADLPARLDVAA
jgi:hypothetical protein